MRMYGFLKEPYKCNKNKAIYKVIFTDELDEMGWIEIGDPLVCYKERYGIKEWQAKN